MPDYLTNEERQLIDEAVAAGRVTKVPYGQTSHGGYEWNADQNMLRQVVKCKPENVNIRVRPRARNSHQINTAIAAEKRRVAIIGLAKAGKSQAEISKLVGVSASTTQKIIAKLRKEGKL